MYEAELIQLIYRGTDEEIISLLNAGATNVGTGDNDGVTVLMMAIGKKRPNIARLLIERGANVNAVDRGGVTPLMHASSEGLLETVQLLIAKGANTNAQDHAGYTAMHYAAREFQPEIVSTLIEAGANVEVEDKWGNTPLMRALDYRERGEIIHMLLRNGADRYHKNKHGLSPLDYAEQVENRNWVQFFKD